MLHNGVGEGMRDLEVKNKMWSIFKMIRFELSKDPSFNGQLQKIEDFYYLLSRTLLHDKSILEFKRRFESKTGECVITTDYDNPICDNSRDGVILNSKGTKVFKLKMKNGYLNVNWKRREPTAKFQDISIGKYYYDKYKKKNIKIIFAIPNSSHPEYYNNGTELTVKDHTYYLLDLNSHIQPNRISKYGEKYYTLKDMVDFRLISKDQTQIKDFDLRRLKCMK